VPACVLVGFGLGLVMPGVLDLPADTAGPVFLGTLALGLVAVLLLSPDRRAPLALQPYFVPVVLVIVGLYLLVEPKG
ncbi:MAG: hypothetical protein M3R37_07480, partial [Actinomycetota bacterium]|nr:hypothetical protein [Actinomycetota bacterium]